MYFLISLSPYLLVLPPLGVLLDYISAFFGLLFQFQFQFQGLCLAVWLTLVVMIGEIEVVVRVMSIVIYLGLLVGECEGEGIRTLRAARKVFGV